MINKDNAGTNDLGSCNSTDNLIDYLNLLDLTDDQCKIVEGLIKNINDECISMSCILAGADW